MKNDISFIAWLLVKPNLLFFLRKPIFGRKRESFDINDIRMSLKNSLHSIPSITRGIMQIMKHEPSPQGLVENRQVPTIITFRRSSDCSRVVLLSIVIATYNLYRFSSRKGSGRNCSEGSRLCCVDWLHLITVLLYLVCVGFDPLGCLGNEWCQRFQAIA